MVQLTVWQPPKQWDKLCERGFVSKCKVYLSQIAKHICQPPNKRDKLPERGIFLLRGDPRTILLQQSYKGGEIASRSIRPHGQEAPLLCKVGPTSDNGSSDIFIMFWSFMYFWTHFPFTFFPIINAFSKFMKTAMLFECIIAATLPEIKRKTA